VRLEDQTVVAQVVVVELLGLLHPVQEVPQVIRVVTHQMDLTLPPLLAEVVGAHQVVRVVVELLVVLVVKRLP
jgi:hypothetical protein